MPFRFARGAGDDGRASWGARVRWLVMGVGGALLGLASGRAAGEAGNEERADHAEGVEAVDRQVVFAGESRFTRIVVVDEGPLRFLRFGGVEGINQSKVLRNDPRAVPMEYLRYAAVAMALPRSVRTALVVGLGAGVYPRLLRRAFPAARVEVVELDALVRDVATRFFGLREDRNLQVRIADGARAFDDERRWELIVLDAYGDTDIPAALATPEFFARVARALAPGGVAVANIGSADAEREAQTARHFARAFPHCVEARTPESGNRILVAGATLPRDLHAATRALDRKARLPFTLADLAARFGPCGA